MIVGGYAVAFHGYPRYTKVIDIWLERSDENAHRLMTVLEAFGFGNVGLKVEDFIEPDQTIQLGYPPNRIDLITQIRGVDFKPCYKNKAEILIEDLTVAFIGLECLKKNKKAVGRYQDLADLENLGEDT